MSYCSLLDTWHLCLPTYGIVSKGTAGGTPAHAETFHSSLQHLPYTSARHYPGDAKSIQVPNLKELKIQNKHEQGYRKPLYKAGISGKTPQRTWHWAGSWRTGGSWRKAQAEDKVTEVGREPQSKHCEHGRAGKLTVRWLGVVGGNTEGRQGPI